MKEIHCFCCGLFLGEASIEVEIICPLCMELRSYVKLALAGYGQDQMQWEQDVFEKEQQTSAMVKALLQKRSLEIL